MEEKDFTPTGEEFYGKKHLPKKICAYCGFRNDAHADNCENCGKDISWIKVPDVVPGVDEPPLPTAPLPEQRKAFTWKMVLIIALVLILIAALVIVLVVFSSSEKSESAIQSRSCPSSARGAENISMFSECEPSLLLIEDEC
ncbi:MAG: hypothetical protein PHP64_01605 [Actinomycetota bacterium]|nr:hypothetical protein [Actinomycetota bacterium]